MKSLVDFINEGNISNTERKYREFCQMCQGYGTSIEAVSVRKTVRNNWAVYIGDKRRFTASSNILDQTVVDNYKISIKKD
jgi:hypothetical protein